LKPVGVCENDWKKYFESYSVSVKHSYSVNGANFMIPDEMEMLISRLDDGDLSDSERRQLQQFLEDHAEAQAVREQYHRLNQQLDQLPDGLDKVDISGFARRVNRTIAADRAWRIHRRRYWITRAPLAAAAALMFATLAWLFISPRPSEQTLRSPVVQPEAQLPARRVIVKLRTPEFPPSISLVSNITLVAAAPAASEDEPDGEVICFVGAPPKPAQPKPSPPTHMLGFLLNGSS
jgi:hypothetical protein